MNTSSGRQHNVIVNPRTLDKPLSRFFHKEEIAYPVNGPSCFDAPGLPRAHALLDTVDLFTLVCGATCRDFNLVSADLRPCHPTPRYTSPTMTTESWDTFEKPSGDHGPTVYRNRNDSPLRIKVNFGGFDHGMVKAVFEATSLLMTGGRTNLTPLDPRRLADILPLLASRLAPLGAASAIGTTGILRRADFAVNIEVTRPMFEKFRLAVMALGRARGADLFYAEEDGVAFGTNDAWALRFYDNATKQANDRPDLATLAAGTARFEVALWLESLGRLLTPYYPTLPSLVAKLSFTSVAEYVFGYLLRLPQVIEPGVDPEDAVAANCGSRKTRERRIGLLHHMLSQTERGEIVTTPPGYPVKRSTFADDLKVIRVAGIPVGVGREHWEALYVLRRVVFGACRRFDEMRPEAAACPPPTTKLPWYDYFCSRRQGPRRPSKVPPSILGYGLWPPGQPCPLNKRQPRRTAGDYDTADPRLKSNYLLVEALVREMLEREEQQQPVTSKDQEEENT